MSAYAEIAAIRADLVAIHRALDHRHGAFEIGLLRESMQDILQALSRATSLRPHPAERDPYGSPEPLLDDLRAIRERLERCILSGELPKPTIGGDACPALHHLSRGIVGLINILGREAARAGAGA